MSIKNLMTTPPARPIAATITGLPVSDELPRKSTPGPVPIERLLRAIIGQDVVVSVHGASATEFAAVDANQYSTEQPVNEDWFRHVPPDDLPLLRAARLRNCPTTSLLFQTLHDCFDQHLPVSLAPEVLWYAVLHEVGIAVKRAPDRYAHLFTTTPDTKEKIIVFVNEFLYGSPDNDWARGIELFRPELKTRVPSMVMAHALPAFSTRDAISDVAHLVAFLDAASPFYEYVMYTCCGIPAIRLEGRPEDWDTLAASARALRDDFAEDLGAYFDILGPVLDTLARAAHGEDVGTEFWQSMVKVAGDSGGPYVTGWITAFWNYVHSSDQLTVKDQCFHDWRREEAFHGLHPSQFTSHVSVVPFEWNYYNQKIPMVLASGILSVVVEDGFYCPRLGWAVIERRAPPIP